MNEPILILVQSCFHAPHDKLWRVQLETWDSVDVPRVETIYFAPTGEETGLFRFDAETKTLNLEISEHYRYLEWRFKLALQFALEKPWTWIFRTNGSSYVDKRKLVEFTAVLPKEHCYCGIACPVSNAQGIWHVNGGGMWLSRDVAELLARELPQQPTPYVDDGAAGLICQEAGVPIIPGQRYDWFFHPRPVPDIYLYRVRSMKDDREEELVAMREIHELKKQWRQEAPVPLNTSVALVKSFC